MTRGAGTCSRGDETGKAWTLNEKIDSHTPQANMKTNCFVIGFSVFPAPVDQVEANNTTIVARILPISFYTLAALEEYSRSVDGRALISVISDVYQALPV